MNTVIISLMIVISIILVLVILIQNSKGGGLAAGSQGNQIMGVKRTTDFLEKATWSLAIALIALALISKITGTRNVTIEGADTELREKIDNMAVPNAKPAPGQSAPAPAPKK